MLRLGPGLFYSPALKHNSLIPHEKQKVKRYKY